MAEQTHVVVCGGGPTGVLLSALLSTAQVPNIVLEQAEGITTDPRGIALDEDGIRTLQAIGVYDKIFTEIGSSKSIELCASPMADLCSHDQVQLRQRSTLGFVQATNNII